jgi:four helix bundle protein
MHEYSFEKLRVWQRTRVFVKKIYLLTGKFPDREKFGIVSQLQRAVVSVSSNIAEGSSRKSGKDQGYFLQIAYSSLMESLSQLILAFDLGYIKEEDLSEVRVQIEEISNLLNSYSKSILKAKDASVLRRLVVFWFFVLLFICW